MSLCLAHCSLGLENKRGERERKKEIMVRTPCCEKMGLKRGPWSPEEDHILISYIQNYGHSNWRALPKQAGLLRCGKSCRLRWTNYLRPDIKRGNFTKEEEDTIINLHKMLGNRWSAIAARLPGRTDNEIKNVWHTHLKKRLTTAYQTIQESKRKARREPKAGAESKSARTNMNSGFAAVSPAQSDSDFFCSGIESSSTATGDNSSTAGGQLNSMGSWDDQGFDQEIDESFWAEIFSMNSCDVDSVPMEGSASGPSDKASFFSTDSSNYENDSSFWLMNFMQAGEFQGLLEI